MPITTPATPNGAAPIGLASFEHRFVNLGAEYLDAADRVSRSAARIDSDGYSFWITPRAPLGAVPVAPPAGVVRASLEGLFRFDRRRPNRADDSVKDRWIAGVAYWPSMRVASVSAAFLLDYEHGPLSPLRDAAAGRETARAAHAGEFLGG